MEEKVMKNYEFWFVVGSQHLYGPEVIQQVEENGRNIVKGLIEQGEFHYTLVFKAVVKTPDEITALMAEANGSSRCAGIIGWMHTFSPGKMWISGLSILNKPFLHLHTQYNRDIPWNTIDMDFMNLNQSAHGGREFGFINTRLRKSRKVVVGHWKTPKVQRQIYAFMNVAIGLAESKKLKIARFGDNMRFVAVTEGDKVEAEIKLGWQVHGYGIGDLVEYVDQVTEEEVEEIYQEYTLRYKPVDMDEESVDAIKYQGKLEIAMERFLLDGGFGAFTTTFEDLHGLNQLPGLAVQRLMEKGYGFAGEGDWKTAGLTRLVKIMGQFGGKGTSFMEDYTYHLEPENEMVLGAHMLEVCPSIASEKPNIQVKPLGIGNREAPARLTFSSKTGVALNATLVDMGGRLRLIINEVKAVDVPQAMPHLPVATAMWKPEPSLEEGAMAWILAGGAHHTVFSLDVTAQELLDFAEFLDIEAILINKDTNMKTFRQDLKLSDVLWNLKG